MARNEHYLTLCAQIEEVLLHAGHKSWIGSRAQGVVPLASSLRRGPSTLCALWGRRQPTAMQRLLSVTARWPTHADWYQAVIGRCRLW